MDVLTYSAYNENRRVEAAIAQNATDLAAACSATAGAQTASLPYSDDAICWLKCVEPCLIRCPHHTALWTKIPTFAPGSYTEVDVCTTDAEDTEFNCGKCCLWTVPAGASLVRFQLWGAGGGSGSGCCCGGSPFGSTGAYASAIMKVTPGCQYTICAGCAAACWPVQSHCGRYNGCPSFVQGFGLDNFCADGGGGLMNQWMGMWHNCGACRLGHYGCACCGPCFCNRGSDYCFVSSQPPCGHILFSAGAMYYGQITNNNADEANTVYGIRGMWPSFCADGNHYGHQCHPPIYGFESESLKCCCFTGGTTICGYQCRAACGKLKVPGAGGHFTVTYGGSNNLYGDAGKKGMVRIQYI